MRLTVLSLLLGVVAFWRLGPHQLISSERLKEVRERVEADLKKDLEKAGLKYGSPVFVRVLKEEHELELCRVSQCL